MMNDRPRLTYLAAAAGGFGGSGTIVAGLKATWNKEQVTDRWLVASRRCCRAMALDQRRRRDKAAFVCNKGQPLAPANTECRPCIPYMASPARLS
ncbi:hypothetical protein PHLGIDRAFT_481363 [Phlebiopsis gigantea 11061_1 CR5-6]|uniref:Uncharacterized protein n=1 Tax=Phlebiopsis gigantea (strain 11061_1 CR5-6) TaxID=745531 RepID=A0A0C3NLN2_PHLG1|nr:hypothetical protein PHLGIDRAFT_481363 [Phlebiopsis gigantea 11061_1 CR5-6]